MNKKFILVLVLVLAVANSTSLSFDLQSIKYTKAADFWTVNVPTTGGSGNFSYACELPVGWRIENNCFRIPASHAASFNQEFVPRCRVRDNIHGNVLERALSFKCTNAGFVVADFDYLYGHSSFSVGSLGAISGLDILKRLSNLGGSLAGGFTGSLNTGGFSTGLPSWNDCDALIKDGNVAEILALIQKLVSSTTIKCDAKIAFLNDLLGRLCAAIDIKGESVFQLKALIDGIVVQINKLKAEIATLTSEKSQINLDGLNKQLSALLAQLQAAYNQYNQCISSTTGLQKELAALRAELKLTEEAVYQLQIDIAACIAKVKDLNDEISQLEIRLTQLKKTRSQVEAKCNQLKAELVIKTKRVTELKNLIDALIQKIKGIQAKCAGLKTAYEKIQYDIKCLKEKIAAAELRYHQIDERLTQINVEIERLNGQISAYELKLKNIRQCIENLNSALKEIKQTIHYLQYNCNDCPNVIIDDSDFEPCFKFNRKDWFNYMNRCYGAQPAQLQISFPAITVEIKAINVFSPIFQQNYGFCFGDQVKTRGSQWDNFGSYGFDNDFSCSTNAEGLSVKKGIIRAISNKHVDVDCDDGQQVRLRLGSCSKFEGQGRDFIPKVGHNIHFKGSKNFDATFNLHSCSCY